MYLSIVLLASLLFGACRSDDGDGENGSRNTSYTETPVSEAPDWHIDWNNNQECPDWSEPDFTNYENWTILMAEIEKELQPFVSEDDMMALFVNGELRGLAKNPATSTDGKQTISGRFIIKAYGNETDTETVNIALKYYCQNLKHLFTLSENITLDPDETIGIDEEFIPEFTKGSAKYPVVKMVIVENLLAKAGIKSDAGNMTGAFVGEECRGKVKLTEFGTTQMFIYGRTTGESVTLKYYDANNGHLFTIADAMKM